MQRIFTIILLIASVALPTGFSEMADSLSSKGIYFGCTMDIYRLNNYPWTKYFVKDSIKFNTLTLTGFDIATVCTALGKYDFNYTDSQVDLAETLGVRTHVNCLVFQQSHPSFMDTMSNANIKIAVTNFLDTITKRYKGRVNEYDVLNDYACNIDDSANFLYNSFWEAHCGPKSYEFMFHAVKYADSNAILFINSGQTEKTDGSFKYGINLYRLLSDAKLRNVPIDAIGFESHLFDRDSGKTIRNATVFNQIKRIKDLGYRVSITELDVGMELPVDTIDALNRQAKIYAAYIESAMRAGIYSLTVWGYNDSLSWINTYYPAYGMPNLWSHKNGNTVNKKPAYDAIVNMLKNYNHSHTTYNKELTIRTNKYCIAAKQDSTSVFYDMHNITSDNFWNGLDSSTIILMDSLRDTIPSKLSGFNLSKKMGLLWFTTNLDTTYKKFIIAWGGASRTNDSMAIKNGSIATQFDFSSVTGNKLIDLCGSVHLDSIFSPDSMVIDSTDCGFSLRSKGNAFLTNKIQNDSLKLNSGSLSFVFFEPKISGVTQNLFSYGSPSTTVDNKLLLYITSSAPHPTRIGASRDDSLVANLYQYDPRCLSDGFWHYFLITFCDDSLKLYVEGQDVAKRYVGNRNPNWTGNDAFINLFSGTNGSSKTEAAFRFLRLNKKYLNSDQVSTEYNMVMDNKNFWKTDSAFSIDSVTPSTVRVGGTLYFHGTGLGYLDSMRIEDSLVTILSRSDTLTSVRVPRIQPCTIDTFIWSRGGVSDTLIQSVTVLGANNSSRWNAVRRFRFGFGFGF